MDISKFLNKKEYIKNILNDKHEGKISTGYLFFSPDKVTNAEVLKYISKILLCDQDGLDSCPNCLKIESGTHPDVLVYPKGASFAVADSRDIIEQATKKPMLCDKKIIIINDFDVSSEESQNKLLKTLEEPPKNVIFLASATNLNNVLATIKSRLLKIEIPPFSHQEITSIFKEYVDKPEFELSIQNGDGFIGKTEEILQNPNYLPVYENCKNIVLKLKSSAMVINFIDKKLDKNVLTLMLYNLQSLYRDLLVIKSNQENLVKNKNLIFALKQIENEFSINAITSIIKNINEANKRLYSNVSPSLILESLLVKNLEVKYLCK